MRVLFRIAFMFLAFTLEVKVHALSLDKDCSANSYCYFFAENLKVSKLGMTEIRFQPGASLKKVNENFIEIVTGSILVDSKTHVKIKTLYGEVLLQAGRTIIDVNKDRAQITALSTGVFYLGRGQSSQTYLKPTLIVNMRRVGSNGVADVQFPQTIAKQQLIRNWSKFYRQSERQQLAKMTKELAAFTILGPHELAYTYYETAKREQASLDLERAKERARNAKYLKETEYLRDLFRKKNYLDYSSY